ncbi:unnamed protein product [Calypogeia fissa]
MLVLGLCVHGRASSLGGRRRGCWRNISGAAGSNGGADGSLGGAISRALLVGRFGSGPLGEVPILVRGGVLRVVGRVSGCTVHAGHPELVSVAVRLSGTWHMKVRNCWAVKGVLEFSIAGDDYLQWLREGAVEKGVSVRALMCSIRSCWEHLFRGFLID